MIPKLAGSRNWAILTIGFLVGGPAAAGCVLHAPAVDSR